ncbi:hypothetical protein T09_3975 [Trichinella sp. T9]|nr:hypothetical protein T09_3975 [Trichinella sp. T9]
MTADLHLCMMVEFTCWNTQILKTNSGFAIVYVIFYYYNTLFLPNSIPISYVIYTTLEVNTVLRYTPHANTCTAYDSVLYKIEKRNTLKRHAGEETKPVPQIYGEECSGASTNLETTS